MGRRGTRRAVLLGAVALVGGFQLVPGVWDAIDDGFDFEPLETPRGFRKLSSDRLSTSNSQGVLIGLDSTNQIDPVLMRRVTDDPCVALFHAGEGVPVAAFSDYYCPNCRILDARVNRLADEGLITLRHHETPIFGVASEWAAKGAIAARKQGQGQAYFDRMITSAVRANPPYLRRVAEDINLNVDQFESDMGSAETTYELQQAAALKRLFRFVGTPALVVGQTALQGAMSETNLRQLIDLEREQIAQSPCR